MPDITGDGINDLDITDAGSSVTIGGAIFGDAANIGSGTGNYNTFLQMQDDNDPDAIERGFNTADTPPIDSSNPEIKQANTDTVLLSDLVVVEVDGKFYYEFRTDLNENDSGLDPQISLDTFKLYASDDGEIVSTTQLFNETLIYDMDAGGNVSVLMDEAGSTGSGTDDYSVLIPVERFAGLDPTTTYIYLYVEMGAAGTNWGASGGFHEWNIENGVGLTGTKFEDANNNGLFDTGEDPIEGIMIYIDANQDGAYQVGERFTFTDEDGNYAFYGVSIDETYWIDEHLAGSIDQDGVGVGIDPNDYIQSTGDHETITVAANATPGSILTVDPIGNYLPNPSLTIVKIATVPDDCADVVGEYITYTITVDNNGNLALTNVVVTDSFEGGSEATLVHTGLGGNATLDPGEVVRTGDTNGNNILDTNETWTYTYVRAVTQADIDSDGGGDSLLSNVATANASSQYGAADEVSDDASVGVCPEPALAINKVVQDVDGDTTAPRIDEAGDVVTYDIIVTNTGNVTLTNVIVTDPLTGTNINVGTLAPGASTTVQDQTYTVLQSDIDGNGGGDGDLDNTATADSDQTGAVTDSESVPIDRTPALAINKVVQDVDGDTTAPRIDEAGDVVTYDIIVTNTGNVTLTNVIVTDPLTGTNINVGTLAPGASTTVQDQTYTVLQSDIDGNGGGDGDLDNTATADSDQTGAVTDSESVPIDRTPALAINKVVQDVDGDTTAPRIDEAGDVVTYDIIVTNTGNVTLTNVIVTDPLTGTNINVGTLAPGASTTVQDQTYTVLQSDIDGNGGGDGDLDNTATADSDQTGAVTDSESVPIDRTPALAINKVVQDVDGDTTAPRIDEAGDVVTYDIIVTNTGNVTLTNVIVTDPLTGTNINVGTLAPGASTTVQDQTYTVLQSDIDGNGGGDGDLDNTATADSDQTGAVTDSESVPIDRTPALAINKVVQDVDGDTTAPRIDEAGDVVTYDIIVTNTGNVTLTNVIVTDPLTGTNINVGTLAPGASTTVQDQTYTVLQSDIDGNGGGDGDLDNTATADSDQTGAVTDSESVPIDRTPALAINKVVQDVDGDTTAPRIDEAGDVVTYDIIVTNTGNVTLTNVIVTDPLTGTNINVGTLAPGASTTVQDQTYTVLQSDIDGNGGGDGDLDNTATADSDQTGAVTDSESVPIDRTPALAINKVVQDVDGDTTAPRIDEAGDVVTYDIIVTNTGNVTLTNVIVTDPLTGTNINVGTLAPGASTTVQDQTYTVLQSDIDGNGGGDGDLDNTATADSDQTGAVTDSESVPIDRTPAVDIIKYVSLDGGATWEDANDPTGTEVDIAGGDAMFKIIVTNIGNTTLTNVVVQDSMFDLNGVLAGTGWLVGGDGILSPNESHELIISAPLTAGQHVNTATVTTTQGVTDLDRAHYFGLVNDAPGVRTPGFWSNWTDFWDGDASVPKQAGQEGFPGYDLLRRDTDGDGDIDDNDNPLAFVNDGMGNVGLLLGDYNRNGVEDGTEDTLFIDLEAAQLLINASQKDQQDGRFVIARDVIASWLNYLAGNEIGADPGPGYTAREAINDAIDFLQVYGDADNDGIYLNGTGKVDWEGSVVRPKDLAWKTEGSAIHSALDQYNNSGSIGSMMLAHDGDDQTFLNALRIYNASNDSFF